MCDKEAAVLEKEGVVMHMKRKEFSKIILIMATIAAAIVILFTFVMVWRTCDLTPLQYVIAGVFSVLTVGVGFYYWKARLENSIKLKKKYEQPLSIDDEVANADASAYENTPIM